MKKTYKECDNQLAMYEMPEGFEVVAPSNGDKVVEYFNNVEDDKVVEDFNNDYRQFTLSRNVDSNLNDLFRSFYFSLESLSLLPCSSLDGIPLMMMSSLFSISSLPFKLYQVERLKNKCYELIYVSSSSSDYIVSAVEKVCDASAAFYKAVCDAAENSDGGEIA